MVSRILKFLNRTSESINEAALLLGLFTLVSQLLGLVRDRLLATYLGAGHALDAYYAAFDIPDFLYVSVATLAAITVLLPYLSERYANGDAEHHLRAKKFLNQVFTVLFAFLAFISVLLFIFMPWIAHLTAPGFSEAQRIVLVRMSRVMLLQPIIVGVSNMVSSVTQMFRKFFVAALAPVMYNLGIIFGIIFLRPVFGIMGLAYGVVLGAVLHLLIQIPVLAFHKFIPKFTLDISWSEIKSVVMVSIPRTIGLSISSFSGVILTAIASLLGTGSIAIFNLTNNMLNVPVGIIGIAYSTASFPLLVKLFQTQNHNQFSEKMVEAVQKVIFFALPITVLFIILRAQIVRVILGAHSFSWNDTRIAAACVALFVLGLVCQSLVYVLVRGYYAIGNTKTPLFWNIVGEIATIIFAVGFVWLFRHSAGFGNAFRSVLRLNGISNVGIEILALPLGFALGNILNFATLWSRFSRDFPKLPTKPLVKSFWQVAAASLALGGASYGVLQLTSLFLDQNHFWGIFAQGLLSGLAGIIIAGGVLSLLKNKDMNDIIRAMRHKFWRASVVQELGEAVDK